MARSAIGRVLVLGLAVLVGGCVDDTDTSGPQFATDPRPTREPTAPVIVTQPPAAPTPSPVPRRPFAELVVPRGAPDRIYFTAGPELWTVDPEGASPSRVFSPAAGSTIAATSPSPSSDRVAVLVTDAGGTGSVRIVAADGREVARFDALADRLGEGGSLASPVAGSPGPLQPVPGVLLATPAAASPAAGTAVPISVDWSPQGDQLLVGFDRGGPIAIPISGEGEVRTLVASEATQAVHGAAWSPTGEQVAFLTGEEERGYDRLAIADIGPAADSPRPLVTTPADRAVVDFAWLPDGRALLFTEGDATEAHATNTDLWRITTSGGKRTLVASAGSAAPVADVALVAPSPDGRAVAYTVEVPGDPAPVFHSLWIRDLAANQAYPVVLEPEAVVTELWWTSAGLVFRAADAGGGSGAGEATFGLYRVAADGTPQLILRAAVDAATPAATPVAG